MKWFVLSMAITILLISNAAHANDWVKLKHSFFPTPNLYYQLHPFGKAVTYVDASRVVHKIYWHRIKTTTIYTKNVEKGRVNGKNLDEEIYVSYEIDCEDVDLYGDTLTIEKQIVNGKLDTSDYSDEFVWGFNEDDPFSIDLYTYACGHSFVDASDY